MSTSINPIDLGERFEDALVFASQLHRRQRRKGGDVPYISHLLSVTAMVLEDGGDEDEAIAALLHDAVEDQGGQPTLELIRTRYGDRVAQLVMSVTDADTIPKPPWRPRKEAYIAHLAVADPGAVRIACADKLHNARSTLIALRELGPSVWDRSKGKREGMMWYLRSAAAQIAARGVAMCLHRQLIEVLDALDKEPSSPSKAAPSWETLSKQEQDRITAIKEKRAKEMVKLMVESLKQGLRNQGVKE